ncbi:MAG: DinB family protein [Ignavibacteria bacterium]|jgi:hypothetical protein|nr:DinB family protein [Ignavibacteria bacterium]
MNVNHIIAELEKNKSVFKNLLENLPDEFYQWRESENKWNLLEVVCHLYDEERDDFRARVKSVLANPLEDLLPIDPTGWVTSRNYAGQNYVTKLNDFLIERDYSIAWLKHLKSPEWGNSYSHPKLGPLTAKMFLVNWLAHDYLHIRQIIRIKYEYLKKTSGEILLYAGDW